MEPEPKQTFVSRRPVLVGIIIGCIASLPIVGYFGISRTTEDASTPRANTSLNQNVDLKIRGNRNSRIYHLRGCPNYDDIAERNIVDFKTHEEAQSAGYRKARNCP